LIYKPWTWSGSSQLFQEPLSCFAIMYSIFVQLLTEQFFFAGGNRDFVSALRQANQVHARLSNVLRGQGGCHRMVPQIRQLWKISPEMSGARIEQIKISRRL
jgi:hypothetical protein